MNSCVLFTSTLTENKANKYINLLDIILQDKTPVNELLDIHLVLLQWYTVQQHLQHTITVRFIKYIWILPDWQGQIALNKQKSCWWKHESAVLGQKRGLFVIAWFDKRSWYTDCWSQYCSLDMYHFHRESTQLSLFYRCQILKLQDVNKDTENQLTFSKIHLYNSRSNKDITRTPKELILSINYSVHQSSNVDF